MQAHLQSGAERTPAKFYKTKREWTLQMGLSRNADKQYLSTERKLVAWEGVDLSGVKYTKEKSASNDNNVSRCLFVERDDEIYFVTRGWC